MVVNKQRGVTLLELLIAMAILAILITVAYPSMQGFTANQRLLGATEQVFSHLQQARSEAVARSTAVFVNFAVDGTASWEYGVSSVNPNCDLTAVTPTTANACVIVVDDGDGIVDPGDGSVDPADLVLMRYTDADFTGVVMNTAGLGGTQFTFDGVRGMVTDDGVVNLTGTNGNNLRVRVSLLGRVDICTPDGSMTNYENC